MRFLPLLSALVSALALTPPALALESVPVASERARVTLVSEADSFTPGHDVRIALRFRLAPGWHIYWQNPGDAGAPPSLALDLPAGVRASDIAWPVPQVIQEGDLTTYGYTGEVLLPVTLTAPAGGETLAIAAQATWLVCATICVPEQGSFRLTLPPGTGAPSAASALFRTTDARLPRPAPWPAHVAPDATLWLGSTAAAHGIRSARFFAARPGTIRPTAARLIVRADMFAVALAPGEAFDATAGLAGVLVLTDHAGSDSAFTVNATPAPLPATLAAPRLPVTMPLARTLLLAFLGGLILNLMPCVFPVLAMKAMTLLRLSGTAHGRLRTPALSYTAGVLAAFGALAVALLVLRAAGLAAGWGFQFQSPVFVAAIAWLLFGVGLGLSGVFEVGGAISGVGQGLTARGGHLGSFFTGLLAVLVATPCTAPFMGVAIATGLAAAPPVTLTVFLVMGLGLAAPYVLLAMMPRLAGVLPRPGAWMAILKQALAFPMYAASGWLVWVLSQEAGPSGVLGAAAGLVLLGFAGWTLGLSQRLSGQGRRVSRAATLAAVLAAVAVLSGIELAPLPAGSPAAQTAVPNAEPFSAARLAALEAEGRPVFVEMTAAWCITCLVNERVALAAAPVQAAFTAHRVAYLRGDWTRQDPAITAFLRRFGRDGVPLYALYPGGGLPVETLPQILTPGIVTGALDRLPTRTAARP